MPQQNNRNCAVDLVASETTLWYTRGFWYGCVGMHATCNYRRDVGTSPTMTNMNALFSFFVIEQPGVTAMLAPGSCQVQGCGCSAVDDFVSSRHHNTIVKAVTDCVTVKVSRREHAEEHGGGQDVVPLPSWVIGAAREITAGCRAQRKWGFGRCASTLLSRPTTISSRSLRKTNKKKSEHARV